jgi:hypothetical protein
VLYIPFDQNDEGNHKSLEILLEHPNFYNDPSFQEDGIELLYKMLKSMLLCHRITKEWLETGISLIYTENWKKSFDAQLTEIGVKKSNFNTRLASLKFEFQTGSVKDVSVEDEREEDQEPELTDAIDDIELDRDISSMRCGPLAMAEVDETVCAFESDSLEGILYMMKRYGTRKLKNTLKLQTLEHYWNLSATELTNLILLEVQISDVQAIEKMPELGTGAKSEEAALKKNDLNSLVPSIMNQKKLLRKIMLVEFAKENRNLMALDISQSEKDLKMKRLRDRLIEFYYRNMINVVSQEVERSEFAKFMADFRTKLDRASYSNLIFSLSPITKYSEFLSNTDSQNDDKPILKQPALTQG